MKYFMLKFAISVISGKDEWMDDLRFYVLFNSISFISGRWAVDNGTPFAVEKISPRAGLELGTARSVAQRLTH